MFTGFGDVAKDTAVDNCPQDEVDVSDEDESQSPLHQPPGLLLLVWKTETSTSNMIHINLKRIKTSAFLLLMC